MRDEYGQVAYIKKKDQKPYFEMEPLPFHGFVSLGNMTAYKIFVCQADQGLLVGIEGKGMYTFGGWVHADYAAEKLNLPFRSDAAAVADFINAQLGHTDELHLQGNPEYPYMINLED